MPHEGEAVLEAFRVTGTEPRAGETAVPVDTTVRVTLSRPADPETVHEESLLLKGPLGQVAAEVSSDEESLVLTPAAPLVEGAEHRVIARRTIRDTKGIGLTQQGLNVETDYSFTFQTEATPPRVVAIDPEEGEEGVTSDPPTPVTVTFSEPMDNETIDQRCITVRDGHDWIQARVACVEDDCVEALLTPMQPWREGRVHEVLVHSYCADLSGIPLEGPHKSSFVTGRVAPEIVQTDPEQGETGVGIDDLIVTLEASKPLDDSTVEPWNLSIEPDVPFRVAYDDEQTAIVVRLDTILTSNITYSITVSDEVADVHGNSLEEPFTLSFVTAVDPDNNPPGPIEDLAFETRDRQVLTLIWTAPGGDTEHGAGKGEASHYDVRRSKAPISDAETFSEAEPVPEDPPVPAEAGTVEHFELRPGLNVAWHYAVAAHDEAGNVSYSSSLLASIELEEHRWRPEDASSFAGTALALADLNGNGYEDLIVGAPGRDSVYVFPGTEGGPDLEVDPAIITGPTGSFFGASVAAGIVDGSGGVGVLAGAPLEDEERGAAYLLIADGDTLPEGDIAVLADSVARGTVILDRLGTSVAIGTFGELEGDGSPAAVIGAPGDGLINDGAIWIAAGTGDTAPDLAAAVERRGGEAGDRFGWAVLAGMDITGDGTGDIVVGAPGASGPNGFTAGRVDVFSASDDSTVASLHGLQKGGLSGTALAWGDVTGDGETELAVGAPFTEGIGPEEEELPDAGAAYLFAGPIAHDAEPIAVWAGNEAEEGLGAALAITAPLIDGMTGGLALGSPGGLGAKGFACGTVRLIHFQEDGSYHQDGVLEGTSPGDGFGSAIISADLDGDGLADLVIGSPTAESGGRDRGRVRVLR